MSLRVLITSVCFVSTSLLQAQYDDLLRNPDITWVAEYTTDFVMNPENEDESFFDTLLNSLDLIQLQNAGAENGLYGKKVFALKYLSQQILKNAKGKETVCFKDSLAQLSLKREEMLASIMPRDTSLGFDHPWDTIITVEEVTCDQIRTFRIRQVFWYSQKNRTFDSRLLTYAPLVNAADKEGNIIGKRTLFWLKADRELPKHFKNKRFSYIFQTKMRDNAPRFEDFKVLKGRFDFRKFFGTEIETPSRQCLDRYDYTPADMSVLRVECYGIDTIVTFHPETYEEQIQIEQRNCIEQIERIRFVQNWYYDEQRHRLYARLIGVAPLAAIRDSEGNLRFYKPLFYQMYR